MPVLDLDDAADPRCADYLNIPDADLVARRGAFVAEGRLVVRRLLDTPALTTRSVMVTRAAIHAVQDLLLARPALPVYVVPQSLMDQVTGFHLHRGCLAIGERPPLRPWRALAQEATCLVALERVGNADNVGAVFRNAAAFGAGGVLLGPACADPLYRKAIRTSMGAALSVPFARAEPWPDALDGLRAAGWTAVGLSLSAGAAPLASAVPRRPHAKVVVVAGHEGTGLTAAAAGACDVLARIPMAAGVDSLNVAVAAGIALYEIARAAYTPAT